ncbi:hypothetical protein HRI_004437400 [Hibiscus trionum]|uniref:non-specific serine/threonine protein kinase n=1 Tax=Hibiscus trionum TaxID=183268 RepID=A0A9W7J6S9_HIBTR|nr:hypothetical protein HRI_004437400 [Hibiscus trionum]
MLLSPSLSPSPLDSPSPVSPPETVVQLPLPPPPVSASPPLFTPQLAPISTLPVPPTPPPVLLPLVSPPPASTPVTPPQLQTPPVVVVASPPQTPPVPPPPPPALVIIPPPLLPKSPSPPPQQSRPLPLTPPSDILPPPAPATTAPSLPPPRVPIAPPPFASISPPPPPPSAAPPSISAPKTPGPPQALQPPPAASHSIGAPNTPGFFHAFPPPAPPPPLSLPAAKGGFPTTNQRPHSPIGLVVASLGVGILLFVVFALVCICCKGRTRRRKQIPLNTQKQQCSVTKNDFSAASIQHKQENVAPPLLTIAIGSAFNTADTNGSTSIFTYEELVIATDGFSESNLLGQGGFGYVYKGRLPTGQDVAVKKLKAGSRQGEREFQAEIETISRVHHKHLVYLVGYCINGAERLLVYEFVPNKTLEFHLHENGLPVILWESRLKIAIGSAKGIAYLHEDCSPTIIHRDIKAANILLDPRFEAKVSDFGLAKIFFDASPSVTHISTRVMGTFGYLAPEYALTGKLTDKSDVYSYGVMLLELITGRRPIIELESSVNQSLVDWARPLLTRALEDNDFDTLVDPRLNGVYNNSEMATMVSCAAACIRQSAWLRPRMIQVVRALEDDISLTMLSNSSLNTSSEMFIQNARRCINNGDYSESTSEYGLNLNPSGSSTESQRTKI